MARMFHWLGCSLLVVAASGCVSMEKYAALKIDRDQFAERLGVASSDAAAAKAESDAYKRQLEAIMKASGDQGSLVASLTSQISELQQRNAELDKRYAEIMNRPGATANALPAPLTSELSRFATENPDLVDFDSARGVVKFKSDVIFAPGSAEVTAKAKAAITRFASILNSATASGYELMVVGHTDNQHVVQPATIAAGHKDNWYLSAHRAIAVSGEMQRDGVSVSRLEVAGFADQRPITSNATEVGRTQNRRVEVLIMPTTVHSSVAGGLGGAIPASERLKASHPKLMNKDSAETDNRPYLQK